jgi:ferredoxin/coenzyme F420-reducing hydrogenase delta subunit
MTTPEFPAAADAELRPRGAAASESPEVRGEAVLRWFNKAWDRLDALVHKAIAPALNPFGQLGAIANICLIIAVISGVALLYWYTPSVHKAYASLEAVRQSSSLGQLVRSIHRYSSDGCLFFILLHACRIACQRRITGPRWLSWTTGLLLLALISFIGWTGYWLVWDVRARHAALGTARFMDSLPIFAEPLSRSFLTDATVPSLLFFLIFFMHMLAPLAMGVGIWMHLMRVNRARFIPGRIMIITVLVSLTAISIIAPASSESAARMTQKAPGFTMDWWYLWPLVLTDRLGGGALWGFFLTLGVGLLSAPWWLAKRKNATAHKAEVELARCIGCSLCAKDCPFNAITMIAREDGRKFAVQSLVNPDLCVGCGICTGACDSSAINLPALNSREAERRAAAWIRGEDRAGRKPFVAFACGESGGALLTEKATGYFVQKVPCAGWVSAVLIERLIRAGAAGVMVIGCGESDPRFREGGKWFGERLSGAREPKLDLRKVDPWRVRYVKIGSTGAREVLRMAHDFREGIEEVCRPPASAAKRLLVGAVIASILCAVVFLGSDLPYRTPHSPAPELIVSFNHSGALIEARKLSAEELAKRLPHMRAQASVTRARAAVRLRISIDGNIVSEQSFAPKGLSKDGPSIGLFRQNLSAGEHQVTVELADSGNQNEWTRRWSEKVDFKNSQARVVLFDTKNGFSLH